MQIFSADKAIHIFDHILDAALEQPVAICRPGSPAVVIISLAEYQELLDLKRQILKAEVSKGFEGFDSD